MAMIAFAFLIVLFPLGWRSALRWFPGLEAVAVILAFARLAIAVAIIVARW